MWVYSLPPLCVVFSGLATVPDCLQITNGAKLAGGLFYRTGATLEASGFFVSRSSLDLITFFIAAFHSLMIRSRYLVLFLISFLIVAWYSLAFPCGGNLFLFRRYLRLLLCFSLVYLPLKGFGACACCLFSFRWPSLCFRSYGLPSYELVLPADFSHALNGFLCLLSLPDAVPVLIYRQPTKGETGGGGCAWVPSHPVRFLFSVALVRCCPWSGLKTSSASCTRYAVRLFRLVLRLFGGSFLCRRVRLT